MNDPRINTLPWQARAEELEELGYSPEQAFAIATFEHGVQQWPVEWGLRFRALVYGDFEPPDNHVSIPSLGIDVEHLPVKGSVIDSARTVLTAWVSVPARTVEAVSDASRRLDILTGLLAIQNFGNVRVGWWAWMTHAHRPGGFADFTTKHLDAAATRLNELSPKVAIWLRRALVHVNHARPLLFEWESRGPALRAFDCWWSAFECLIEAVCSNSPPPSVSRLDREASLQGIVDRFGGRVNLSCFEEMKRVEDRGFRKKVGHALRVALASESVVYLHDLFGHRDPRQRLYDIRNRVRHSSFDDADVEFVAIVEDRSTRLFFLVWRLVAFFLRTRCPLDWEVDSFRAGSWSPT